MRRKNDSVSFVGPVRTGLTLLEVLVVMGIIAFLVGMLIPAVQSARETARRTQCTSNLKQIILAYHEVQESVGRFPGVTDGGASIWRIEILPYLEEIKPFIDKKTGQIRSSGPVATYLCASDPYARGEGVQNTSYYPNIGRSHELKDGFFQTLEFSPIRPADVTDGLSNTSALSEHLTLPGLDHSERAQNRYFEPIFHHRILHKFKTTTANLDVFADECQRMSVPPFMTVYTFGQYNHVQTPNRTSCYNRNKEPIGYAVTATSLHPGGVNVAMGDGAVRFVNESLDRNVWRALGSRNGGETIENSVF